MSKEIKFTEEEVSRINDLRIKVSEIFAQLGQTVVEKKRRIEEIDKVESDLMVKHGELVEVEKTLFEELSKKYGDGNYNPETGIFTPTEPQGQPLNDPISVESVSESSK